MTSHIEEPPLRDKLTLTVPEAGALSGIPARVVRAAVLNGDMPACYAGSTTMRIRRTGALKPLKIKTMPHPGFPTDMQPLMTVLLTLAEGTSIVTEGIWENRFRYVDELIRMGANIQVDGQVAVIEGVKKLSPAPLRALDLRAGAAMVMAALAADGVSEIDETAHIERGYENIVEKLQALGADIRRVETPVNAVTRAM